MFQIYKTMFSKGSFERQKLSGYHVQESLLFAFMHFKFKDKRGQYENLILLNMHVYQM